MTGRLRSPFHFLQQFNETRFDVKFHPSLYKLFPSLREVRGNRVFEKR